jgi:YidC/Oxa1 family membrane protein insertase
MAALLSLGVLILWQVAFPPPEPPQPPEPLPATEAVREAGEEPPSTPLAQTGREDGATGAQVEPDKEDGAALVEGASPAAVVEPLQAEREERIVIETSEARVEFTNQGAQIVSFELLEHRAEGNGDLVDLVRHRTEGPHLFALTGPNDAPSPFNERFFVVEQSRDERGQPIVTFRYRGLVGQAEKSFKFRSDGLMEVAIDVANDDRWGVVLGPGVRNPSMREIENRFARRSAVFRSGDEVETVDAQGEEDATVIPGRGLVWFGLQDTYFLTALMPAMAPESVVLLPTLVDEGQLGTSFRRIPPDQGVLDEDDDLTRELEMVIYPGAESFVSTAYFGAKNYDRLASFGVGLQRTVALGVFSFLARPLLWALLWTYDTVVANYGWAIVLLTIVVRIVLFPLTYKSTVSMRKMQKLNPQMQAIRQKYRAKLKDKKGRPNADAQRKMNEEIMGLYKKEGVNPAGGCLPILLQMPVLFAFYSLLSAAVELRNAPWILWIQDLSAPDPFYVLPLVMGASQYVQQKMMPATGDPTQRRIMMLMPAFFTILFLKFASGLVLYWLTTNLLTIVQQAVTNKLLDEKEEHDAESEKKHKKDRKP